MEEFFGNLFKKDSETSNQSVSKVNINNEDRSIRNLVKRANIGLANKNMYGKIHNLYENITRDYAHNVAKVVYHRNGKRIGVKDTYLLDNLLNQNMFGGNYSGYCDNNIGQCSDSFAGSQCGGYNEFCDGHPSQCGGKTQQGGFIEFCDGHPSQCGGNKNKGSYSKTQFKNLFNMCFVCIYEN